MTKTKQKILSLNALIESGYQFPQEDTEEEYIKRFEPPYKITQIQVAIEKLNEPDRSIFLNFCDGIKQKDIGLMFNRDACFISRSIKRSRAKILLFLETATND